MALDPIGSNNLSETVIRIFAKNGSIKEVLSELSNMGYENITESNVKTFLDKIQRKTESPLLVVNEHDADLIEENIRQRINLQEKTIDALEQAEGHIVEIEENNKKKKKENYTCPNCNAKIEIEVNAIEDRIYHSLKDSAIKTKNDLLKHLRSTQIKFMELAKNQILRESILTVIKDVDPDIADKIFQKIEQKQREIGIV